MKLSYQSGLGYVITNGGAVVNTSDSLNDLLIEYGEDDTKPEPFFEAEGDDYDVDLAQLFDDLETN